jgi:peptidoglycan/LPS O-acetylase OafA/YrhL
VTEPATIATNAVTDGARASVPSSFIPGRLAPGRVGQFDGLRSWAIAGVFVTHYLMNHKDWWIVRLDPGYFGVRLFFVLSGFLITGILLNQKTRMAASGLTLGAALRLFYLRRFLRLSPLYYLTIAAGFFYFPAIRDHAFAFLLYLQNYVFISHADTFRSAVGHLWTLAIEEQFYLAWPLFILLCPGRRLPLVVAGVSAFGAIFGLGLSLAHMNRLDVAMFTPTNLLTLGLGALVAVLGSPVYGDERQARRLSRAGRALGPSLLIASIVLAEAAIAERLVLPLRECGSALLFSWLIGTLSVRVPPAMRWALLSKPARYVGTISYAIYLFHMPLIDVFDRSVLPRLGVAPPDGWLRVLAYGGFTVALASLSWWALESRIARLKDRLLS